MNTKNTSKSTTILDANGSKKSFNPAEVDDLGFFPTLKMSVVVPVKSSIKMAAVGFMGADALASGIYRNREKIAKNIELGIDVAVEFLDDCVVAVDKLNCEFADALGVEPGTSLEEKLVASRKKYQELKKEENK